MKNLRFFFAGVISLGLCSILRAQPSVSIRSEVNPREIYIGDPVMVNLFVSFTDDVAFRPIQFSTAMGNFELLAMATPTVTSKDGKITAEYKFILTTFSTGSQTIPALPLSFAAKDGSVSEAKTEEISIKVHSLLEEKGDEGNLRPLKGLFDFKSYFWWWMTTGLLALAALFYFLVRYIPERRRKIAGEEMGPPRPPEELAWEALHTLEDSDLLPSGQYKEFYFQLSMIIREYLERRYGISAVERTTAELLMEFRRQNFTLDVAGLGRDFFDNADLVKFAKFTPDEKDIEGDVNRVKQFINLTTPQKQVETPKEKIPV